MIQKKFFLFLVIWLISLHLFALDTLSIKYMPMHVGDFWVYNGHLFTLSGGSNWIDRIYVTNVVIKNNHNYYYLNSSNGSLFNSGFYRGDSLSGSLYRYDSTGSCLFYNHEKLSDSLAALNGDSIKNCNNGDYRCIGTQSVIQFGESTYKISFKFDYEPISWGEIDTRTFVKNYGLVSFYAVGWGSMYSSNLSIVLKGCRINGILYGDTSSTSIEKINDIIPSRFYLYQNYPNPFNPYTKIKFEVPTTSHITIVVFNVLGKQITILVDEKLQSGIYETIFNGSKFASGIYFYRILTNEYSETLKMLLIK